MSAARNSIPRREFLVQASVGTAGALGATVTAELAVADDKRKKAKKKSPADVEHVDFESLVGEKFVVSRKTEEQGVQEAVLELGEVKLHRHPSDRQRPRGIRESGYSLLFVVVKTKEDALSDGIYQLDHPQVPSLELFLHPTMRDKDPKRQHLVAVFN